jgi:hypothetical protein
MLGLLIELALEILFEVGLTALTESGARAVRKPRAASAGRRATSPWLLVLIYGALGVVVGGLSLLVFSNPFMHNPMASLANLVLSPIAGGLAMALLGAWRKKRGQQTIQMDTFAYGFVFAFVLALVRFIGFR